MITIPNQDFIYRSSHSTEYSGTNTAFIKENMKLCKYIHMHTHLYNLYKNIRQTHKLFM